MPQKKGTKWGTTPNQTEKSTVAVTSAKGRPMLSWVGKRTLRQVTSFPAQHIETFNPTGEARKAGMLFHGDNKEVLAHLLANGYRGKINLIYIDPPFDSGADYVRKVELRGVKATGKLAGEAYTLGEQIQYTDIWANDNYLQFMYERLLLMKELLAENGCIWLHCDHRKVHHLRVLLEEVFGGDNFLNTISWRSQVARGAKVDAFYFPYSTHYLEIFAKNKSYPTVWHIEKKELVFTEGEAAEKFMQDDGGYFRTSDPGSYTYESLVKLREENRLYAPYGGEVVFDEKKRRVYTSKGGNIGVKYYLKKRKDGKWTADRAIDNLWDDIPGLGTTPSEDTGFPTQKTEALLQRVISVSTDTNAIVFDCFLGSGTTAVVAQKLGRRWIGCDINKGAIQTTCKRLQTIIAEQVEAVKKGALPLPGIDHDKSPEPAQLSFSVYRVNDYDLQIQHNEAVNLACEHIGVTRTKTDAFFDGTLGKRLVKIIPFGHPLTILDMEEVKRELAARPDEERDVVVVSLGKELAVDGWLEEWNRLRKKGNVPNKIEVIELRTDLKYGKFIAHQPAQAKVSIKRVKDRIVIEIEEFISPSIIERLSQQEGVLIKPKITDWRATVDSVMIDPAYNGKVFNIMLSDVPEKKSDLVSGEYELPAPKAKTTVAVKITDMLGEEVLIKALV